MRLFGKTTKWKKEKRLQSVNFCVSRTLLQELDWWVKNIGTSRSHIIREGIRLYMIQKKNQLADQEKRELEAWQIQQQNRKRTVHTGLLPNY